MKQTILTLTLALSSFVAMGQTKHRPRYFYVSAEYICSDGCTHQSWLTTKQPLSYYEVRDNIKKYIKPYKIASSFKLVEYKPLTHKEYLSYKGNKFEPCKPLFSIVSNTGTARFADSAFSIVDTSSISWKAIEYSWYNNGKTMSVSVPDSNKMITVKFNPKLVKFINDSTFVFKQP